MRDFRIIKDFDLKWKDSQNKMNEAKSQMGFDSQQAGGDPAGLGDSLNQYIQDLEEEGHIG